MLRIAEAAATLNDFKATGTRQRRRAAPGASRVLSLQPSD